MENAQNDGADWWKEITFWLIEKLNQCVIDSIIKSQKLIKNYKEEEIYNLFIDNNYDITKLDVNRLFRYIDRYTLENAD